MTVVRVMVCVCVCGVMRVWMRMHVSTRSSAQLWALARATDEWLVCIHPLTRGLDHDLKSDSSDTT